MRISSGYPFHIQMNKEQAEEPIYPPYSRSPDFISSSKH